ncbi:SRPBCC family protein [Erythrobacter insulae]|uniref:SRPBCC family protein n=1 Tax=Erythrobacter insulae TaxID=2584124 RepID=A0A547PDY1_9SPHN|nr:SRPBCC family protein [Erythrobacter insulae]TRD12337.1 SRPBCC family protein [Erythrobacter insulae]
MRSSIFAAAAFAGAVIASPLAAEITEQDEAGFVTRDEALVEASPKQVWLALITPATWWNKAHTWSGDSGNLTLRPQAGGCFCERIPEVEDADRITLEGSVEHMRVIQAYPESALRMAGALGPLQSEPVSGVLTIAISEAKEGTRIVWEYHVGGRMRFDIPAIAKAVDGVISQQLDGLAQGLGRLDGARPTEEPAPDDAADEKSAEADGGAGSTKLDAGDPDAGSEDAPNSTATSAVDDAFGDLTSDN